MNFWTPALFARVVAICRNQAFGSEPIEESQFFSRQDLIIINKGVVWSSDFNESELPMQGDDSTLRPFGKAV
jgi:hypothetical protein